MSDARLLLPTDVLPLISYNPRAFPNQAWPRERLGGPGVAVQALGVTLNPLLTFVRGRSVWISTSGPRLASRRMRCTSSRRASWSMRRATE